MGVCVLCDGCVCDGCVCVCCAGCGGGVCVCAGCGGGVCVCRSDPLPGRGGFPPAVPSVWHTAGAHCTSHLH